MVQMSLGEVGDVRNLQMTAPSFVSTDAVCGKADSSICGCRRLVALTGYTIKQAAFSMRRGALPK